MKTIFLFGEVFLSFNLSQPKGILTLVTRSPGLRMLLGFGLVLYERKIEQ